MPRKYGTQSFVLFDDDDIYAELYNEKRRRELRRENRVVYDTREARKARKTARKHRK